VSKSKAQCQHCRSEDLVQVLDLGEHPFSTGLPLRANEPLRMFNLDLVQCAACGLLQLRRPARAVDLTPFVDWVTYREPEGHLDTVCEKLLALPGLAAASKPIFGVTSKDDTLLQRLAQRGGKSTRRLDLATDLGVTRTLANVEAVPDALTSARAKTITQHYGKTSLVICRHILEHAGNLGSFLAGLNDLVAPGGYLMLEVPDCSSSLARRDYTMIWEEHSVYFTPGTFFRLLQQYGFEAELTETYPYPYENCLVLVARKVGGAAQASTAQPTTGKHTFDLTAELEHGQAYGTAFDELTQQLRKHLGAQKALKPVALYGAGHLTASFVNYHGLADLIDCVVDDTPQKQGLLLPGSGLPILSSAELQNRGIGLCVLGLAPEVEPKVVQRNAAFVESGGQFRSLLAASPSYVLSNPV
jgi:hypothetical protein